MFESRTEYPITQITFIDGDQVIIGLADNVGPDEVAAISKEAARLLADHPRVIIFPYPVQVTDLRTSVPATP